jgi:hypothetical protein
MHEVFPPYRAVLGPGLAIEPRVPQNCTRTLPLHGPLTHNPPRTNRLETQGCRHNAAHEEKFHQRAAHSGRLFFSWLKANPDKELAKKNLTE